MSVLSGPWPTSVITKRKSNFHEQFAKILASLESTQFDKREGALCFFHQPKKDCRKTFSPYILMGSHMESPKA